MNSLEVKDLSFKYPRAKSPTLSNISFKASEGKITALIGPNGAGKTTLIKTIVGILKADGEIIINGENIKNKRNTLLLEDISYLTQENSIISSLSVFEVVLMGRIGSLTLKVPDEEAERVWDTLNALHIESLAERSFYALSGGQRKMVNIAQAIVKDPKILILDEPTANLDMQKELEVMDLVSSYTREMGTVTVVTLHDLNTACRFADNLVLLKDGKVFDWGLPGDVITKESIMAAYGVIADVVPGENNIPHVHPVSSVRKSNFSFKRQTL